MINNRNQWLSLWRWLWLPVHTTKHKHDVRSSGGVGGCLAFAASSRFGRLAMPTINGPMTELPQTRNTSTSTSTNTVGGSNRFLPAAFFFFSYQELLEIFFAFFTFLFTFSIHRFC